MRINRVSINTYPCSFSANKGTAYKPPIVQQNDNKKLKAGLIALGVLGMAAIGYGVVKNTNKCKLKSVKNFIKDVKNLMNNKPVTDSITKQLDGRRGAEAVKIYNGYRAVNKLESMHNKLLNGYFDGKPAVVFEHLRNNERIMQRQALFAV